MDTRVYVCLSCGYKAYGWSATQTRDCCDTPQYTRVVDLDPNDLEQARLLLYTALRDLVDLQDGDDLDEREVMQSAREALKLAEGECPT